MGMMTTPTDKDVGECIICIFLNEVEQFDKGMRSATKRSTPVWISQFNYQCLLNIPSQVEKHGPPRNRYEGGLKGEGYIHNIKPVVRVRSKNWQKNLLLNLMKKSIDEITNNEIYINEMDNSSSFENEAKVMNFQNRCFSNNSVIRYKLSDLLLYLNKTNHPVSIIISSTKYYVIYQVIGKIHFAELIVDINSKQRYKDSWYYKIEMTPMENHISSNTVFATSYAVILPLLKNDEFYYTICSSEWKVWNEYCQLVLHSDLH